MSLSAPAQLMLEAYPDLRRWHKGLCAVTAVRIVRGCGVNACARNEKKADAEQSMTSSTDGGQPKLFWRTSGSASVSSAALRRWTQVRSRPSLPRMIRSHSIWMKMPRATRCSAALRRADGIRRRSRCGSFREYTDRRRRHRHERRTRVAEADAFRRYASGRKRNSGDSAVAFASRSRQRDLAQHHAQLSISESSTSRRL